MAAKKEPGKTILNKTRSSKERWTHFAGDNGGELVNGKDRHKVSEFANSDHPMKDEVLGWMAEKGIELPKAKAEAKPEPAPLVNETTGPDLDNILSMDGGTERDRLISMHFGDLNREVNKGATRKLRKQLREMGYTREAGLPAA